MTNIYWTTTVSPDVSTVAAIIDGQAYNADSTHPNFERIVTGLAHGDDVSDLFSVAKTAAAVFETLSDRVSVMAGDLFFDGDPVDNSLAEAILGAIDRGENYAPLVLFMERLAENPSRHSRQQAYDWLSAQGTFTIDSEGYLLGYKGVAPNGDNSYKSIASGTAYVNGEKHTGQIPQSIGDTVSMARSDVEHDPSLGCHRGLHVGTWDYASGWGHGVVLKVRVNPRDIVSVPTDCGAQKMRVHKYEVVDTLSAPMPYLVEYDEVEDEDMDEWDDEFDYDLDGGIW